MMRFLASFLVTVLTLAMIGGVVVFGAVQHYGRDLPSLEKLQHYEPATATRLYAGDGKLLAEYASEKRVFVPLPAMPKRVVQAFISAEDQNYYEHPGVDFMGVLRAMLHNVANVGKGASLAGGSTITQQVVKNFLLTNIQSIDRKIKEALLAFRISKVFSKNQILELYLNDIYLGKRAYGVAAASLNYFDKSLDELTLEEAALLAALPKAPANYDPRSHYERAKDRRNWVLDRMREDGYITRDEMKEAQAKPITLHEQGRSEYAVAAFFAEEVRRELVKKYGADVLYGGGLSVYTTVDPKLQVYARDALRRTIIAYDRRHGYRGPLTQVSLVGWLQALQDWKKTHSTALIENEQLAVVLEVGATEARIGFINGLEGTIPLSEMSWARTVLKKPADIMTAGDVIVAAQVKDKKNTYELRQIPEVNGAMMAMDPHTGRVLAMVGGYSAEKTEFNRATQAKRQPGSSFKPFVYMSALESGFTPSSIVLDSPISLSQGVGRPLWTPKNYGGDYLGPTTLRHALETSRNVVTVRLALQVGIKHILNMAYRFGVYDKLPPVFSIVLGSSETTLDRIVGAYGMIVNGGKRIKPSLIERIQNRKGETIFRRDSRICKGCEETSNEALANGDIPPIPADVREQVIDPRIAYQMVSLMEGVVQRGTATGAKVLNRPVAGKTGTTNDSRDAWFIGYTPDLVAGVYIGFDTPKKLGNKETGGKAALPGFVDFMQHALKDVPSVPFRIPENIRLVKTDMTTGQAPTANSAAKNIIFEPFLDNQQPGAVPALDVSTPPVFDKPMIEDGQLEGRDPEAAPDTNGENGAEGNEYHPGAVVPPAPENSQAPAAPETPVMGTGGLY